EVEDPERQGQWYSKQGCNGHPGLRFFPISGDVQRPGVYEVPVGTPLRALIEDSQYAQGMLEGKPVHAVAPSGPTGGFLPARLRREFVLKRIRAGVEGARDRGERGVLEQFRDQLEQDSANEWVLVTDLPLSLPVFRILGPGLGGIVVYAEGRNMIDVATNCVEF